MVKIVPLQSEDLNLLLEIFNDEQIHSLSVLGYAMPVTATKLKSILENWLNDSTQKIYKVMTNDLSVGFAQIFDICSVNRKCKIGISIKTDFQGNGIGRKVISHLVNNCFNHLNLHKIEAEVIEYNVRCIELLKKLGFVIEGIQKESVFKNGEYRNICLLGLKSKRNK